MVRLVARLYAVANLPLRIELIACLVRPLGPLGPIVIADGAFSRLLRLNKRGGFRVVIDDAVRFTGSEIAELAAFAQQVNPKALEHFARIMTNSRIEIATFSKTSLSLLSRELQRSDGGVVGAGAPTLRLA